MAIARGSHDGTLRSREIVYVPDFIASAGGLMYASGIELHHQTPDASDAHTRATVVRNVATVLDDARNLNMTTQAAAIAIAESDAAGFAGFADPSHLGRRFKACYGSTPGQISSARRSRSYTSSPRHAGA